MAPSAYPEISAYAFISNCRSCALITRDASVEWACFVRFDARPVFARLLDREIGGFFRVAPAEPFESHRRYVPDTNVLETTFETSTGVVTVTDCLPVREDLDGTGRIQHNPPRDLLVRRVRGVEGSVELRVEFRPRFDYGLTTPLLRLDDEDLAVVIGGADALLLQSDLRPLEQDGRDGCVAHATVEAGDEAFLALTYAESARLRVERLEREHLRSRLEETVEFWTGWSSRCAYRGRYRDVVVRSALVLKGLTNAATGAVVAAATTSLPEEIGGCVTGTTGTRGCATRSCCSPVSFGWVA